MFVSRTRAARTTVVALVALIVFGGGIGPAAGATTAAAPGPYDPYVHSVDVAVSCAWTAPVGTGDPGAWVTNLTVQANYPDRVRFGGAVTVSPILATSGYHGPQDAAGVWAHLRFGRTDRDGTTDVVSYLEGGGPLPATSVALGSSTPLTVDAHGDVGDTVTFPVADVDVSAFDTTGAPTGPVGPPPVTVRAAVRCTPLAGTPPIATVAIDPPVGGVAGDEAAFLVTRSNGSALFAASGFLEPGGDAGYTFAGSSVKAVTGSGTFRTAAGSRTSFLLSSSFATDPNGNWTPFGPPTQLLLVDPASGLIVLVPPTAGQPANGIFLLTDGQGPRTVRTIGAAKGTVYPTGEPVTVYWSIRDLT